MIALNQITKIYNKTENSVPALELGKTELAEYCLPTDIVVMDELPLTAIGKVDYLSLSSKG